MRFNVYFTFALLVCASQYELFGQQITGTWNRVDKDRNLAEIFVVRANGDFVSTLFLPDDVISAVEKGYWTLSRDSVTFNFDQVVERDLKGKWISQGVNQLHPVSFPIQIWNDSLYIGQAVYYREP